MTYGAGGSSIQKNKTCEICGHIKEHYHIEPVAHLTCVGAKKEEILHTLDDLKAKGVENILALRGTAIRRLPLPRILPMPPTWQPLSRPMILPSVFPALVIRRCMQKAIPWKRISPI